MKSVARASNAALHLATAITGLSVLAIGIASAGERGKLITVEHRGAKMAIVSAGTVSLGADEDELVHLGEACSEVYPSELSMLCEARRFIRRDFGANLAHELPSSRVVAVPAFAIDKYEVTVAEYRECVEAASCDISALLAGDERYLEADLPMVNVTWRDARQFCAWREKRLPTEAEWEKAARGTDERRYPWGNQRRRDGANVGNTEDTALLRVQARTSPRRPQRRAQWVEYIADGSDGFIASAPPGSLPWGEGPYGAFDMAGNVREWVQDYYSPTLDDLPEIAPVRDTPRLRQTDRVVRGGSWLKPLYAARVYYRDYESPEYRGGDLGFRCARTVEPRGR